MLTFPLLMFCINLNASTNKMTFDPKGLEVKEGGKNVYTRYLRELEIGEGAVLAPRDVAEDIQNKPVLVVNNIAEKISSAEYFKNRDFLTTQYIKNLESSSAPYAAMLAQGQEGPLVEELVTADATVDALADAFSTLGVGASTAATTAPATAEANAGEDDLLAMFRNLKIN